MRLFLLIGILFLAPSSFAEEIISPKDFEEMSEGRTLHFSQNGATYGTEQYFTNRRATWQFADGQCVMGYWFAQADQICFVYENDITPICWYFLNNDGAFSVRGVGDDPEFDLHLESVDEEELNCPGPEIGV